MDDLYTVRVIRDGLQLRGGRFYSTNEVLALPLNQCGALIRLGYVEPYEFEGFETWWSSDNRPSPASTLPRQPNSTRPYPSEVATTHCDIYEPGKEPYRVLYPSGDRVPIPIEDFNPKLANRKPRRMT